MRGTGREAKGEGSAALPDAAWGCAFRRRLCTWYARCARDLPWRRSADPYAIWLSEIMLQQTQVVAVVPYFQRFVRALPTIRALAEAGEQQVLRLWEGLGYYGRARRLHRAARIIVQQHHAEFPRELAKVRRLPGIGRYTAGAILSIAFDQRLPILETNTTRLLCRLLAYRGDPSAPAGQKLLWAMAERVLPRQGAGRLNQALMELGSTVCLPRAPRCEACPARGLCGAHARQLQQQIPWGRSKPPPQPVREAAVVIRRRGRVLVVQCAETERWAGLWSFPRFAIRSSQAARLRRELVAKARRLTGVVIQPGTYLKTIRHAVTRFRITLECYEAQYVARADGQQPPTEVRWLRPAELEAYPLTSTARKLANLVTARGV